MKIATQTQMAATGGGDVFDVALTDEDNFSIQTNNANRAIHGNAAMQLVPPRGPKT